MSIRPPRPDSGDERQPPQQAVAGGKRRRGRIVRQVFTVPNIIALAVNVVQNGWDDSEARKMGLSRQTLEEIYAGLLRANQVEAGGRRSTRGKRKTGRMRSRTVQRRGSPRS